MENLGVRGFDISGDRVVPQSVSQMIVPLQGHAVLGHISAQKGYFWITIEADRWADDFGGAD